MLDCQTFRGAFRARSARALRKQKLPKTADGQRQMENGQRGEGSGERRRGAANGNEIEKQAGTKKIFGKQLDLSCAFCQTFCIIYCEIIELMKCALCDLSRKTRRREG